MARTPQPLDPQSFAREAQQARSSETARRILETGTLLFARGELRGSSVADIARAAGVSVGGFYGRYRTKADLERAVTEQVLTEILAPFEERFAAGLESASAADVVACYADNLVSILGGPHRDAIRRLVLSIRADDEHPTRQETLEQNRAVQAMLRDALLERRDQIGHPDPESAIAFMDLAMSAAAREALLHGGLGITVEPDTLAFELTSLGCRYLRIEPPTKP